MPFIQPRAVLQPLIDSIYQTRYASIPFYTDLNALVRYQVDMPSIIPITKTEPEAEVGMSIQYYKQLERANRDLSKIPPYVQYAELWIAGGIVSATNRGPSPKTTGDPTSTYTSIPNSAITNVLSAVFNIYFKVRWDYDPDNYYALLIYWVDAVPMPLVDPPTLTDPTFEQALSIVFYKRQENAENALFKISPEQRLAQIWSNGRKIESNR